MGKASYFAAEVARCRVYAKAATQATRSIAKAPGCLTECVALSEAEAAPWPHAEDDGALARAVVAEGAVADDEMPGLGPVLRCECLGDRLQLGLVGDLLGDTLEHDVEPTFGEVAAPGGQDAGGVLGEVLRLALVWTGGDPDGVVVPDGDQRGDVRPAVGADRRKPERVGLCDMLKPHLPRRRCGVGLAEAMDLSGYVRGHIASSPPRGRSRGSTGERTSRSAQTHRSDTPGCTGTTASLSDHRHDWPPGRCRFARIATRSRLGQPEVWRAR